MKRAGMKKTLATIVAVGILSIGVAAFATEALSPAEILKELMPGKTLEQVQADRDEGETYGSVANEYGVMDQFQKEMLENRKAAIKARVNDGRLTEAEADALLEEMEENMATCDGTGTSGDRLGQTFGAAFGQGNGLRDGTGAQSGGASRNGQGRGQMLRDGSGTGFTAGTGMARGMGNFTR